MPGRERPAGTGWAGVGSVAFCVTAAHRGWNSAQPAGSRGSGVCTPPGRPGLPAGEGRSTRLRWPRSPSGCCWLLPASPSSCRLTAVLPGPQGGKMCLLPPRAPSPQPPGPHTSLLPARWYSRSRPRGGAGTAWNGRHSVCLFAYRSGAAECDMEHAAHFHRGRSMHGSSPENTAAVPGAPAPRDSVRRGLPLLGVTPLSMARPLCPPVSAVPSPGVPLPPPSQPARPAQRPGLGRSWGSASAAGGGAGPCLHTQLLVL